MAMPSTYWRDDYCTCFFLLNTFSIYRVYVIETGIFGLSRVKSKMKVIVHTSNHTFGLVAPVAAGVIYLGLRGPTND